MIPKENDRVSDNRTIKLGLIQHACPVGSTPQQNLDKAMQMIRDAAGQGAHLVATQELFTGPYFPQIEDDARFDLAEPIPGPSSSALCKLADELGIEITASLFEKRAPGLYHNTSIMIDQHGKIVGQYRKMHIPDDPRFYEKYYFTPGDAPAPGSTPWNNQTSNTTHCSPHAGPERNEGPGSSQETAQETGSDPVYSVKDSTLNIEHPPHPPLPNPHGFTTQHMSRATTGMLVCWDQWFPEAARITALKGAQVLFYPTAIGWYHGETADEKPRQREAWQIMQRSHAIANGVFVAAINRVGTEDDLTFWGHSFIADPGGRIIAQASGDKEEVIVADCDLSKIEEVRRGWPFLRDRRIDAYQGLLSRMLD